MSDTKELVHRLELAMNSRRLDALDAIVAADFVRYCEATPQVAVRSLAEFKQFLGEFDTAFPDNVQTFTHIAADGDLIGIYATYQGTHAGPFGPVPATGKRVQFDFAGMFTVRDGMLAELRVTWDNMTVLRQLGLLPDSV